MTHTALIIDDEADIRELMAMSLDRIGLDTHTAGNLEEARNLLNTYHFDVCVTDMKLPDGNGVEFVKHVLSVQPNLPVAVVTAHGNMNAAVEAMKNGAFDFVSKPVDIKLLRNLVAQAISPSHVSVEKFDNTTQLTDRYHGSSTTKPDNTGKTIQNVAANEPFDRLCEKHSDNAHYMKLIGEDRLVGKSQPINELRKIIGKVARTNAPVWITGESGTGKELIASLIHKNSSRAREPFVAINCGAIPSELMESEMFGHKKGSFTGAHAEQLGLFKKAENGTLFLDEVAELPLQMQVKLLRAIQERMIRPVGSTSELPTNVRILSASNKNLSAEVEKGHFRNDLYYRLNVISITAPSLRERLGDIPEIARFILNKISIQENRDPPYCLSDASVAYLCDLQFPGNVRELENILHRAVAMSDSNVIEPTDVSFETYNHKPEEKPSSTQQTFYTAQNQEKKRIHDALTATRWNRRTAAKILGLTYRQLRYRIEQYGLNSDSTP